MYHVKYVKPGIGVKRAAGKDVIIARRGKPVARLTALQPAARPLSFGVLKGKAGHVAKDFDAPLSPELQALFEPR